VRSLEVSTVAVESPPAPHRPDPSAAPSIGFLVAAVLFWIGAVVVGLFGAVVIFSLVTSAGSTFNLWFLVLAVPFGVLLGGAMVTTRQARGQRGGSLAVFLLSLVVAIALHGIVGLLAQQSSEQATSSACSAEELAMLETQSFYGDIDAPPAGTQFGSCYVMLTIEETSQPAWVALDQLLLDNGWQHPFEPDWVVHEAGMYAPYQWLYQGGFVLTVHPEGSHDLPLDDFTPTDDGATTFALDIMTSPCSQQDVATLQPIYDNLYPASGYDGEPDLGVEMFSSSPDDPCQTVGLPFPTAAQAERALLDATAGEGWTLSEQESGRYTFTRDSATVEATISENGDESPPGLPITVIITTVR